MGRTTNPPPQLGHMPCKTSSEHFAQKVHSKLQIRASEEELGSAALQCSQVGRMLNMCRKYDESSKV